MKRDKLPPPGPAATTVPREVAGTRGDLRVAIETALGSVPFTPPVSIAYCEAVRDILIQLVPGAAIDVYHRNRDLVVRAAYDGAVRYELVLPLI